MHYLSRKHILLFSISLAALGFTGKEKYVELSGAMNARSSADFMQTAANIEFVLTKNTKAEILERRKLPSGNYGLKVRVASGFYENKTAWVYYSHSNPTLNLYQDCPDSWQKQGVEDCEATTSPERAQASVTRENTPATREAPEEIAVEVARARAESRTQSNTQAAPPCVQCSQAQPPMGSFIEELTDATSRNALVGAHRVMANIYQSCHVLQLPPYNPKKDDQMSKYIYKSSRGTHVRSISPKNLSAVARTHYYLRGAPEPENPMCRDMTKNPPLYHFGGRPNFLSNNEIDILQTRRTGGVPITGIDCSAFVSTSLSVSGLKLTPSVKSPAQNITNSATFYAYNSKNSCFNRPNFQKNETIKPGDVIAWRGHTFMIDRVGKDPFGIEKAKTAGRFPRTIANCARFQPPVSHLDFTIIQSTGTGSLPAMRVEARNYSSGTTLRSYLNLAVQACRAQFTSGVVAPTPNRGTTLLRHKGNSDPRCMMDEEQIPKLKGEECTEGCFKETV